MQPSWSQHGLGQRSLSNMDEQGTQHDLKKRPDQAKMAKMAKDAPTWVEKEFNLGQGSVQIGPRWPTWSSDGANTALRWPKMRQHELTYEPILINLHFPCFYFIFRSQGGSLRWPKREPRWPSWNQDGPRGRQHRTKMAKLEPTWSQHGSKMPKMHQHEPTLCLS